MDDIKELDSNVETIHISPKNEHLFFTGIYINLNNLSYVSHLAEPNCDVFYDCHKLTFRVISFPKNKTLEKPSKFLDSVYEQNKTCSCKKPNAACLEDCGGMTKMKNYNVHYDRIYSSDVTYDPSKFAEYVYERNFVEHFTDSNKCVLFFVFKKLFLVCLSEEKYIVLENCHEYKDYLHICNYIIGKDIVITKQYDKVRRFSNIFDAKNNVKLEEVISKNYSKHGYTIEGLNFMAKLGDIIYFTVTYVSKKKNISEALFSYNTENTEINYITDLISPLLCYYPKKIYITYDAKIVDASRMYGDRKKYRFKDHGRKNKDDKYFYIICSCYKQFYKPFIVYDDSDRKKNYFSLEDGKHFPQENFDNYLFLNIRPSITNRDLIEHKTYFDKINTVTYYVSALKQRNSDHKIVYIFYPHKNNFSCFNLKFKNFFINLYCCIKNFLSKEGLCIPDVIIDIIFMSYLYLRGRFDPYYNVYRFQDVVDA